MGQNMENIGKNGDGAFEGSVRECMICVCVLNMWGKNE